MEYTYDDYVRGFPNPNAAKKVKSADDYEEEIKSLKKQIKDMIKWRCKLGFHDCEEFGPVKKCKHCQRTFELNQDSNCTYNLLADGRLICNKCESELISQRLPNPDVLLGYEKEIKKLVN